MTKYTPHDTPPPAGGPGRPRQLFPDDLLDACRENPGMWFCVEVGNRASATYWSRRWPDFEIVTRKQGERLNAWITYTGGDR